MRVSGVFAVLAALALLAAFEGCRSQAPRPPSEPQDDDEVRLVSRPAPDEPVKPRRFELVETAVLASSTDASREVTISLPIASTDPGVQDVESLLVRITPDRPYEVVQDRAGNRRIVVRTKGGDAVSCELTYEIARWPWKVDLSKEEDRPLSEVERRLFAADLGEFAAHPPKEHKRRSSLLREGSGAPLMLRAFDTPTRELEVLVLGEVVSGERWFEAYVPGAGWVPFAKLGDVREPGLDRIVIARGADPRPSEGVSITHRWRESPER